MKGSRVSEWLNEVQEIAGFSIDSEEETSSRKLSFTRSPGISCKTLEPTDDQLKAIANTPDLANLHELRISRGITIPTNICLFTIPGLGRLKNLRKLDLSYNMIKHVEIIECIPFLETLIISHNCIKTVGKLEKLPLLKELDLSHNLVEEFPCSVCASQLIELNLAHNMISSVESIGKGMKSLKRLQLEGNAITQIEGFYNKVIKFLPNLAELDGIKIKDESPKLENLIELNEKALGLLLKHREQELEFENERKQWENVKEKILKENLELKEKLKIKKLTSAKDESFDSIYPKFKEVEKVDDDEEDSEVYKTASENEQSKVNASSFISAVEGSVEVIPMEGWIKEVDEKLGIDHGKVSADLNTLRAKMRKITEDIDATFKRKIAIEKVIYRIENEETQHGTEFKKVLRHANGILDSLSTRGNEEKIMELAKRITHLRCTQYELETKRTRLEQTFIMCNYGVCSKKFRDLLGNEYSNELKKTEEELNKLEVEFESYYDSMDDNIGMKVLAGKLKEHWECMKKLLCSIKSTQDMVLTHSLRLKAEGKRLQKKQEQKTILEKRLVELQMRIVEQTAREIWGKYQEASVLFDSQKVITENLKSKVLNIRSILAEPPDGNSGWLFSVVSDFVNQIELLYTPEHGQFQKIKDSADVFSAYISGNEPSASEKPGNSTPDAYCLKCVNKENIIKQLESEIKKIQSTKSYQYKQLSVVSSKVGSERSKHLLELRIKDEEYQKMLELMKEENEVAANTVKELLGRVDMLTKQNASLLKERNKIISHVINDKKEGGDLEWAYRTQTMAIEQLIQIKNRLELEVKGKDYTIEKLISQQCQRAPKGKNENKENVEPQKHYRCRPLANVQENVSRHNPKITFVKSPVISTKGQFKRALSVNGMVRNFAVTTPSTGFSGLGSRKGSTIRAMLQTAFG